MPILLQRLRRPSPAGSSLPGVSIPGRTPSWDEIEQFCRIDGWVYERSTDHVFWQKALPSGEVLETHVSFASGKSMSPGRFGSILRTQLKVTKVQFWRALQTGERVDRPAELEDFVPGHEAWVVLGLEKHGLTEEEIGVLSPEDAQSLLHQKWSEQT